MVKVKNCTPRVDNQRLVVPQCDQGGPDSPFSLSLSTPLPPRTSRRFYILSSPPHSLHCQKGRHFVSTRETRVGVGPTHNLDLTRRRPSMALKSVLPHSVSDPPPELRRRTSPYVHFCRPSLPTPDFKSPQR